MLDLYTLARPLLFRLSPETAHGLTIRALRAGLGRWLEPDGEEDPILATRVWGRTLANPVGLAAGFDKNGDVPDAMLRLGFGFVEVGSVTPRPQPGNPRPRVFRLVRQRALINRLGFNNLGLASMTDQLGRRGRDGPRAEGMVGANLGINKDSGDAQADYRAGVLALAGLVDYLAVNVSSPNTPGLRALQGRASLERLLDAVLRARADSGHDVPVLLKIAPDLTDEDRKDIAAVALDSGIDGLIVSNTTIRRPPDLPEAMAGQAGGLSGQPLRDLATDTLRQMARLTDMRLPLIGVGGVGSGADAYGKIRAGATLVQLYTALVFEGPGVVQRIKAELAARLRADGFTALEQAVGVDL